MVGRGRPHGFRPSGRGHGRGGWQQADLPAADDAAAWFSGRLPEGWFVGSPTVTADREEIIVLGELVALEGDLEDDAARSAAEAGRIARFREDTREERIEIAGRPSTATAARSRGAHGSAVPRNCSPPSRYR